jgi:hypothetical protein
MEMAEANQEGRIVVLGNLSDMMPEPFDGRNIDRDVEEFFDNYKSWVLLNRERFTNAVERISAFRFVLSGTALSWWRNIPIGNRPALLDDLRDMFFAKFRVLKGRTQLKKELMECKYVPGVNCLTMINKFQDICNKLNYSLEVTIEKFIKILPLNLKQFVVSKNVDNFGQISDSIRTYQDLIEIENMTHTFKNVTFEDNVCSLCNKCHKSLDCPSLRMMIDSEINENSDLVRSLNNYDREVSPRRDWRFRENNYSRFSRSPRRTDVQYGRRDKSPIQGRYLDKRRYNRNDRPARNYSS